MNWQVNQRCIYFYAHKLHFRDRKLKNFANICITKLKANPIFLSSHTNPFSKTMAEATKKFWVFPPLPFLQVLSLKTYYITPVLLAFWYFFCFRYAVVTGANKGIGLGICRELAANGVTVVLTARDEKRGVEAVESLKGSGISNVVFSSAWCWAACKYCFPCGFHQNPVWEAWYLGILETPISWSIFHRFFLVLVADISMACSWKSLIDDF